MNHKRDVGTEPSVRSIAHIEMSLSDAFRQLKSIQDIRRIYRGSLFDKNVAKEKEKELKKAWWKACNDYRKVKAETK